MRQKCAMFYGSRRTPGHDGRGEERGDSIGLPSQSIIQGALLLRSILESDQVNACVPDRGDDNNKDCRGRQRGARSSSSLHASLIETYFKLFEVAVRVDDAASSK